MEGSMQEILIYNTIERENTNRKSYLQNTGVLIQEHKESDTIHNSIS